MSNKITSKRVGIIVASATTALILALLFILPSSVFGMNVTLTPTRGDGTTYDQGDTIILEGEVILGDGEFQDIDQAVLYIEATTATGVTLNLPLTEGDHNNIFYSIWVGRISATVEYQNVTSDPYGYGYGFEGDTGGGHILYTVYIFPTDRSSGLYRASLKVFSSPGGTVESPLTRYLISEPPPPYTPVPEEDQVIIEPSADGGATLFEPGEPGQVTTPDQEVSLDIPAGFADTPMQVVVEEIDTSEAPSPPAGQRVLRALSINVYDMLGAHTTIITGTPVRLQISYTDADVASVGGDPSRLVIMRYVEGKGWVTLSTTVDTQNKLLVTNLMTFSTFAVGAQITVGDINADGSVNYLDLAMFASAYGSSQSDAQYVRAADLNSDGHVNHLDLGIMATNYGS
jgi:hypothetical protein